MLQRRSWSGLSDCCLTVAANRSMTGPILPRVRPGCQRSVSCRNAVSPPVSLSDSACKPQRAVVSRSLSLRHPSEFFRSLG